MTAATLLDLALRAQGIPILGVSVGDPADRATWRIDYAPSATTQNQTDGETLRQTFDPASQLAIDAGHAALATDIDSDTATQAVARVAWEELQKMTPLAGQTPLDWPSFKTRVKAVYKALLP